MLEVLPSVLPILLLISLGYLMKVKEILKQATIDEINKIVLNLALPSLLFLNFKDMELKSEYLTLTLVCYLFFVIVYLLGVRLNKIKFLHNPILPFILPNFALGTLGVPLYLTVFGPENLSKYSILLIGHEMFFWSVLMIMLKLRLSGERFSVETLKGFVKNPFILAVVLGIGINILGLNKIIQANPILLGLENFLHTLSTLLSPLILMVIGYGLKLKQKYIKKSCKILAVRIPLILIVGYGLKFLIIDKIIVNDRFFDYAWFTKLILPPSYVIALFIGNYGSQEDKDVAANTIVMATMITVIVYMIFALFFI